MVNRQLLDKITDEIAKQCSGFGVEAHLVCDQVYDNECVVKIDEDTGRKYDIELGKIADSLASFPGIASIYDAGRGMLRSDGYRAFEMSVTDGNWTHTEIDEKLLDEDMAQYFDDEVAERKEKERLEERRKNWRRHLLQIPKADRNAPEEVYLVMAYEPYEWIKNGEKDFEMRSYTERYVRRLIANKPKRIRFQKGYGGPGRPKPEQMVFEVKCVKLYDMNTKDETDPYDPDPIVPTHILVELGKKIG